jgi:OFA family oxalate/formate antiporter-like MFS transporter
MPAFLSDVFGTKELAAIHGRILSAWAMAGITGPLLTSFVRENTGSYTVLMNIFAVTFLVMAAYAIFIRLVPLEKTAE